MTGLENFSLNMSQELCHFLAGEVVGQFSFIPMLIQLAIVYILIIGLKPIVITLGQRIADKLFKRKARARR